MLGRRSSSICQNGISFPGQGLFIHYGGVRLGEEELEEVAKKKKRAEESEQKSRAVAVDLGAEGHLPKVT